MFECFLRNMFQLKETKDVAKRELIKVLVKEKQVQVSAT